MTDEPQKKGEEEQFGVAVPLRWKNPEAAPTIYANEMVITHTTSEFFLIFGEVIPPISLGSSEEFPEFIEVRPHLKVAISHTNMLRFADAIQQNVQNFLKKVDQTGPES